jgi:hypothetical protein
MCVCVSPADYHEIGDCAGTARNAIPRVTGIPYTLQLLIQEATDRPKDVICI